MMSIDGLASLTIDEIEEGQFHTFLHTISEEEVDRFASISGDVSPLHMGDEFARNRGFEGRVVHGAYLASLLSRMIGVHLPGINSLLHSIKLKFMAPAYIGETVEVCARVEQVSKGAGAVVLEVSVKSVTRSETLTSGRIQVGVLIAGDRA